MDLVTRFSVSPNQATADLKRFEVLYPDGLRYDPRAKTYRAGPGIPDPDGVAAGGLLRELRLISEGVMDREDGVLAYPPPTDIAEPPPRAVPADLLRIVVTAIRERRRIDAGYQSLSAVSPRRRLLEPHALVFDGFRWHARARDAESGGFRDFVLGRLTDALITGPATSQNTADVDWNTRVTLEIGPHRGLKPHQRAAIAMDYGMTGDRLILTPRLALAWYVKRRLGLTDGHETRKATEQHIELISERVNTPEV